MGLVPPGRALGPTASPRVPCPGPYPIRTDSEGPSSPPKA